MHKGIQSGSLVRSTKGFGLWIGVVLEIENWAGGQFDRKDRPYYRANVLYGKYGRKAWIDIEALKLVA